MPANLENPVVVTELEKVNSHPNSPEKAMAPHSSTLAWKLPRTEEPGRLQSMGSRRVDTTERLHFHALEKAMAPHSSVLAWRIPGTGEPGGLQSMGSHRVGHDWSDLAAAAASQLPRTVLKNVQTTGQLYSSPMLVMLCSKSSKLGYKVHKPRTSRCSSWV